MRNYIRYIFSAILIAIAASGCTRNDGDIGPWFGQWKLVALTQGDAPVADYQDNIFFSFQSNVFQIITVKGEFDRAICWANWTDGGSTVTIDFAHREDGSAEIDWNYTPPAILGFSHEKTVLDVEKLSGSEIILRQSLDGAPAYTYRLKKWG
ncbi:MAG: lipocalin-like domain-containing protein [Bacteroides sp.]|nr:lipocalin-like domain-containing protein [Bacteroides sp.]MCM1457195.1 lipocalin-like domain-containing protein [Lachnoclostridium sp.]